MKNARNLHTLDVQHNQISKLPACLGELKQLKFLYLAGNQLQALPENIGDLKRLLYLNLSNNQFAFLPETLCGLEGLIELCLVAQGITPCRYKVMSSTMRLQLRGEAV